MFRQVVFFCAVAGVIGARVFVPQASSRLTEFDVVLVLVGLALVLLPSTVWGRIRRVSVGNASVELEAKLREVDSEVQAARSVLKDAELPAAQSFQGEGEEARSMSAARREDPRLALIELSNDIERALRVRLTSANVPEAATLSSPYELVFLGVERGVLPPEVGRPLRDFWTMRQAVVRERAFNIDEGALYTLVDIGGELLEMLTSKWPTG